MVALLSYPQKAMPEAVGGGVEWAQGGPRLDRLKCEAEG